MEGSAIRACQISSKKFFSPMLARLGIYMSLNIKTLPHVITYRSNECEGGR